MNILKCTWNVSGKHVPPAAINEIQSLLVHVQRGCLSGIAPGCGTNRNERLYRNLNSYMAWLVVNMDLEFTFALLTSTFYRHNEHISAGIEKWREEPITAYSNSGTNNDGNVCTNKYRGEIPVDPSVQSESQKVGIKCLNFWGKCKLKPSMKTISKL